jgi:hypothetical protein
MVSIDNNKSFKLPYTIFLEDTKYMTILTRQERERLVLDQCSDRGKSINKIWKGQKGIWGSVCASFKTTSCSSWSVWLHNWKARCKICIWSSLSQYYNNTDWARRIQENWRYSLFDYTGWKGQCTANRILWEV